MRTPLFIFFLFSSYTLLAECVKTGNIPVNLVDIDFKAVILNESRKENNRNSFLDYYLSQKQIKLPEDNFLLIAYQPVGIVSSCVIIDLEKKNVRILHGTHEDRNEKIIELKESELDYLTELNSSDLMKHSPSQSGNFGMDGHSIVIYSKSREAERCISHWRPEYMGLDIFTFIFEYFKNKSDQQR